MKLRLLPILVFALTFTSPVHASTFEGTLTTGVQTGVEGTVIVAPTASPTAGAYTSVQNVTLTASGSASIHYSTDGTNPSCSTGLVYSSPIAINSTQTIKALSCYSGGGSSSVASFAYTLSLVNGGGANVSLGSVTAGQAELPTGATSIVLTNSTVMDFSSSKVPMTSTPVVVGGNTVTLTQAVTLQSGVNGQPVVLTNSSVSNISASIPDGTLIQGPAGWDGTVAPPVAVASSGTAPAGFSVGSTIISIGSPDGTLVFDIPVTILLSGVTGTVGYKPSGSDTWVQITNACGGSYTAPTAPTFPGECYISNGTDTKIVTYHFTSFGSLTANPAPAPVSSGGGGGGGGGGSVSIPVTTTSAPATPIQGQVLGAAVYNFTKALTVGSRGTDVTALQQFLLGNKFYSGPVTGYFGQLTKTAVIAFQKDHGIPQTGFIGPLTRAELNKGVIVATPETVKKTNLTKDQANAIISILESFGADESVIAKVKTSLGL